MQFLLNYVKDPQSYEHLIKIDGIIYPMLREVIENLGLTVHDESIRNCLKESHVTRMPSTTRRVYIVNQLEFIICGINFFQPWQKTILDDPQLLMVSHSNLLYNR